jgi:anti-sigma regulatory factor (Ser/Thr protein kinase)
MHEIRSIIFQGLPFTIGCLGIFIRAIIFNNMVVSFGIAAMITGMAIQNALNGWLSAPTAGCAEITSMMAGMFYGEGERTDMKQILAYGLRSGFFITSSFAVLIFLSAPFIVNIYQITEGADICILAIQTFCIKLIIGSCIWILGLYYSVVGLIRMAILINIVEPLVFPLLMAWPLIALAGYAGFWYIYIAADLLTIALITMIIAVHNKRWPFHLDLFMFLSEILPYKSCQIYHASINDNDLHKVVAVSEDAVNFCTKNGISEKRAFHIALCIEEMCTNILSRDTDGSKVHYIDLKLSISPEGVTYRMKNDGVAYNPFSEIKSNPDSIAGLGIKLVEQLANSIDYHYKFNMNIVSLKW